jgi:hypothetical protein
VPAQLGDVDLKEFRRGWSSSDFRPKRIAPLLTCAVFCVASFLTSLQNKAWALPVLSWSTARRGYANLE